MLKLAALNVLLYPGAILCSYMHFVLKPSLATLSVIHPNKTFNVPMLLCFLLFLTNAAVSLFIPPPCYLHFGLASRSFGTVCLCRSLSDIHCWVIRTASIAGSSSCWWTVATTSPLLRRGDLQVMFRTLIVCSYYIIVHITCSIFLVICVAEHTNGLILFL